MQQYTSTKLARRPLCLARLLLHIALYPSVSHGMSVPLSRVARTCCSRSKGMTRAIAGQRPFELVRQALRPRAHPLQRITTTECAELDMKRGSAVDSPAAASPRPFPVHATPLSRQRSLQLSVHGVPIPRSFLRSPGAERWARAPETHSSLTDLANVFSRLAWTTLRLWTSSESSSGPRRLLSW